MRAWRFVIGACLALAVAVAAFVALRSGSAHQPPVAVRVRAAEVPSAPATTPVPSRPPVRTVPHDVVRAAVPTVFTMAGARFTIRAHVCAMPAVFPLDPPGEQHHTVCWVQKGFGVRPSSDSATSYVLGHSWAEDADEVLNRASAPVTRDILHGAAVHRDGVPVYPSRALDGYRIVLRTPTGTLVYRVHDTYAVAKNQLGLVRSTMDQTVRRRLVLITCAELHGVDYPFNVVVTAYLASSRRAPAQVRAVSAASMRRS